MPDIAGLKLIVPTSVAGSGVSVSASGKVSFTAATTVSVNGCFTSSYDNYLIVVRIKGDSAEGAMSLRLRASGTDASGFDYSRQVMAADNTTVNASRSTSVSSARLFYYTNARWNGDHVYVYGPNLAQPTAIRDVSASGAGGAFIEENACTHSLSTAYDGFSLILTGVASSGALTIYGLAQ